MVLRSGRRVGFAVAPIVCFALVAGGCGGAREYPSRPITLVCPWAAGGGTDRVSRQMAVHLESELGVPVSVVNATGGKGVTGHRRGLRARPDGYTLTMITLELNMLHWSGLTPLTYRNCIPLMSVNEDYAALFVGSDAPWTSLPELEAHVRRSPDRLKASGTSAGGAWHLALAGWLDQSGLGAESITWISSTGAHPSLQELLSGGVDLVCCSLPEADVFLDSGQIRALGVMAPARVAGYDQTPTFHEQGSPWELGGWRGLALPARTPPEIADRMAAAVRRVVTGETRVAGQSFPEFMDSQGFNRNWRAAGDFRDFLAATDAKLGAILTSESMATVNRDRFHPLAFPAILAVMLGAALAGLALTRSWRAPDAEDVASAGTSSRIGVVRWFSVVGAIAVYCLLGDYAGHVLTVSVLAGGLLWMNGTRPLVGLGMALAFAVASFYVFASVLRVPLPLGIWG